MKRTDLALEAREEIRGGEIEGVSLEIDENEQHTVKISTVEILNKKGKEQMGKPEGKYVTLELENLEKDVSGEIVRQLRKVINRKIGKCLVVGLGNRQITPDAIGPLTVDKILVTRHLFREFGKEFQERQKWMDVEAIAPGVMAQTGMEIQEILLGIVEKTKPELVLVIDALAARSMYRLGNTVQITNTGICPGAGVGNNRKELSKRTLGVEVVAIGVPTVVDAETIVENYMEQEMQSWGIKEEEIAVMLRGTSRMRELFMAGKNIDEQVRQISDLLANAINLYIQGEGAVSNGR